MELELQDLRITNHSRYTPETLKNALWEVVYDYSGNYSVYISEDEKEAFLKAIKTNDYFETRGIVMSKRFLLIRYAKEIAEAQQNQNEISQSIKNTRSLINQMDEHLKQIKAERSKYATQN